MAGGQGTFTIDFGTGATDMTVAVSVPAIATGQLVEAWVFPTVTADNTVDNHWAEDIRVKAYAVVNATGFTASAGCAQGLLHGIYTFGYVYN